MFYDLNVACDPRALNKDGDLARTLSFLAERKPLPIRRLDRRRSTY